MNATPSDRDCGRLAGRQTGGFLRSLARDTAGNALLIMGAFAIPLALLAGSAVDMSRSYLVRVRLQQACDAGVLAGRKLMTVTSGTALDPAGSTSAADAANAFFNNNFPTGWMSTTNKTFSASRTSDGQVNGTATVTMPMSIMKMAGFTTMNHTVTCTARLDIGDSDIMFVLDVTGSMGCATGSGCSSTSTWTRADGTPGYYIVEESGSKISSLRSAVKLFRTTLETNKPAASHIRYGFVPYSSSVNVGALITAKSSDYILNSTTYPSRELASDLYGTSVTSSSTTAPASLYVAAGQFNQGDVNYGTAPTAVTTTSVTQANCLAKVSRRFSTTGTTEQPVGTWPTSGTVTKVIPVWTSASSGTCKTYSWTVKPLWRYTNVSQSVSSLKAFSTITDPTKINGTTTKWQGCIEERDTPASTTSTTFNTASLPKDIDPDYVPDSDATRWRPLWPNVIYYRAGTAATLDYGGQSTTQTSDSTATGAGTALTPLLLSATGGSLGPTTQYYGCSAPAKRLAEMSSSDFDSYLGTASTGDFRAFGHTYHDAGMIWGLRLISPDGIWKDDTTAWPGNNAPNRYIVFMTDGLMDPDPLAYNMYGLNKFEAGAAAAGTSDANLATIHNNRFQAACNAAKAKNITVFVVAFDVGSTVPSNLQSCATDGYAYAATTSAALESAFSTIALEIARLRLSQ